MQDHRAFPHITAVAQEIYLDNGKINRDHSVDDFHQELDEILGADGVYYDDLKALDDWLATLSEDDRSTLATGEHEEMIKVQELAPDPGICEGLFDDIFNA